MPSEMTTSVSSCTCLPSSFRRAIDAGELILPSLMYGVCENSTFSGSPSFERCPRIKPVSRMTFIAACAFLSASA